MSVIQVIEGMNAWGNYEIGAIPNAPVHAIDFFVNNYTPDIHSVLSNFTFLTLSQWVQTPLASVGLSTPHGQSDGSVLWNDSYLLTIVDPYATSAETVYGWCLIDTANGKVVLTERYTTPLPLPQTGGVIYAPVSLQLGHYAP